VPANVPAVGAEGPVFGLVSSTRQPVAVVSDDQLLAELRRALQLRDAGLEGPVLLDHLHDLTLEIEHLTVKINIADLLNDLGDGLHVIEDAQSSLLGLVRAGSGWISRSPAHHKLVAAVWDVSGVVERGTLCESIVSTNQEQNRRRCQVKDVRG